METYETLLKSQLKQLEEVLLRRHDYEFQALKQQYLRGVQQGFSDFYNDEIPQELPDMEQTKAVQRWEKLSCKLMARQGGSFETEESGIMAVRSTSQRPDLRMRSSWCHSVMQKRVKMPPNSRSDFTEDMALRMNQEMTESYWYSKFVLGPHSSFQLLWAVLSIILITWDLVTIPMEVFDDLTFHNVVQVVGYVSLAFWVIDMPLHLIFGVQKSGLVELRPRVLAKIYLKSWFPVDLALVALDVAFIFLEVIGISGAFRSVRVLRSMRMLRLLRLLRVAKLQREVSIIANRFVSAYYFMVLKVFAALLVMLSVNHMIACAWYAVGTNFRIDVESNWLKRMELEEVGMFEAYVASLHWSLTQFTPSTNNVAPTNSLERLFAIFVILLAMGCFSSFVGSITATVNALRSIQATKTKQHSEVLRFFAERKMSLDLFQKVKYVIRTEKLMDDPLMENEVTMLKFLPKRFRIQLHEEMYMHDLLQLPFWPSGVKTREHVFLAEVCHSAMQEEIARKYEDIFLPGTECHAAYLMQPGCAMSYTFGPLVNVRVQSEDHLCLISLWAEWQHQGRLIARHGTSRYVVLDSEKFGMLAWRWAGPFYRYLQIFGVLFTGALESHLAEDAHFTDMGIPKEQVKELALRTAQFDQVCEKNTNREDVKNAGLNSSMVLRSTSELALRGI
ncbi:Potassium voltage-gated channel subfamily H member 5 (Ether-a-go-go potassium channel 2) (rEAG2) (Voltage-gated potassium channel subunit Kv10.2) [Durusdinium trenchii]|uniref:Potassium voltage-gated channel subfamily H member 5 (Ether-a-go-go potassium channel 2) (REAG2) (Voltage-gated potassium channel subunit Kv10.2) n=1 Tax=Durusdinium trenchii TaxID=1381693 RepID=A0ABP0JUG8_9DINO